MIEQLMIAQTDIDQVKQSVRIIDLLLSQGYRPALKRGNEYVYHSPFREEKTPSFFVNIERNVFNDFGEDNGDVIRLCMRLQKMNFIQAFKFLKEWNGTPFDDSFFLSGQNSQAVPEPDKSGMVVTAVGTLEHPKLLKYLHGRRCIGEFTATRYLKEVQYQCNGKELFGVGFENDLGGWVIRKTYGYPQAIKPAHYSTIVVPGSSSVNLFEGVFDFLSYLDYEKLRQPERTTIVLNSLTNLGKAMDMLKEFGKVFCYLDNDDAGKAAIVKLLKESISVVDRSEIYEGHKDYNDFYTSKGYWETAQKLPNSKQF